jgi:hypothetical protein
MDKIYIIVEEGGEFDSHWMANRVAFLDEQKANQHCDELNKKKLEEIKARKHLQSLLEKWEYNNPMPWQLNRPTETFEQWLDRKLHYLQDIVKEHGYESLVELIPGAALVPNRDSEFYVDEIEFGE